MNDQERPFHKPVRRPAQSLTAYTQGSDPGEYLSFASATASALLARIRNDADDEALEKLIRFTDTHGIDDIAELWADAPAHSLAGCLWRLYVLQRMIHDNPGMAALLHDYGNTPLAAVDDVLVGAPEPASPDELVALIDTILRGLFRGDFAIALERAAAFCRIQARGAGALANEYEKTEPKRATGLTRRALRLSQYAQELNASAALWSKNTLS